MNVSMPKKLDMTFTLLILSIDRSELIICCLRNIFLDISIFQDHHCNGISVLLSIFHRLQSRPLHKFFTGWIDRISFLCGGICIVEILGQTADYFTTYVYMRRFKHSSTIYSSRY